MSKLSHSCLHLGHIWHKRRKVKAHTFRYPIFYLMLDLDDIDGGKKVPWCLSFDRFNIFSIYQNDYGNKKNNHHLKTNITNLVKNRGLDAPDRVIMLTIPRIFGYSFNPITVYYCLNKDGEVFTILYEVRNTFGEKHTYICPVKVDGDLIKPHHAQKSMHVSPFFHVTGRYDFYQKITKKHLAVTIHYKTDESRPDLSASLVTQRMSLNSRNLLFLFLRIPFVTFFLILGIHLEALKLWLKGVPYYKKPSQSNPSHSLSSNLPTVKD